MQRRILKVTLGRTEKDVMYVRIFLTRLAIGFEDEQNLYRSFPLSRSNAKKFFDGSKCTMHCYAGDRMYRTGTISPGDIPTNYPGTEKCHRTST